MADKKDIEEMDAISAYPPELTQNPEALPILEKIYSVYVQMEFRIPAADGSDAISQIGEELGQGRSYRHYTEVSMTMNARPTQ